MIDLGRLTDPKNREALLLAEVAAWLHDDSKHTDQFIFQQANKVRSNAPRPSGKPNASDLIPYRTISLLGQTRLFSDVRKRDKPDFVNDYLRRCHNTAHIDKQDGDFLQTYPFFVSTPFGFEHYQSIIPKNLTRKLRTGINWSLISKSPFSGFDKENLKIEILNLFLRVGADTRRPSNEITLWDWGHTVGAFYKASLAGALLGFQPTTYFMRWRLLSIRFDGISFFTKSSRLSDLLSRQELLKQMLNEIRQLLEIEYPLGTEVYRDENGSIFIVPGCYKGNCTLDLLTLEDRSKNLFDHMKSKAELILEGEFIPGIKVDSEPWWGQDPNYASKKKHNRLYDELPPLSDHLQTVTSNSNPESICMQWSYQEDICTVCGLRPIGPSQKSKDRNVCEVCEIRRSDRSKKWATENLSTTIWIDEVADINARLALVVGCFDLNHWLSGKLVGTLATCNPANATKKEADEVAKNPSFTRLRRIWETTRGFWQEVYPTDENKNLQKSIVGSVVGLVGPRLEIMGTPQQKYRAKTPGPYHAYDLVLPSGIMLSVAWDPEEGKSEEFKGRFISIDNLIYFASLADNSAPSREKDESEEDYSLRLSEWIAEKSKEMIQGTLAIKESMGYSGRVKEWGEIDVKCIKIIPNSDYTPAIPILAEPRTFMALVPADKALDIVKGIKTKYEREMGKVRNRLPLNLGIVYAHKRTPLRVTLDAGRRMLEQSFRPEGWKILYAARKIGSRNDQLPEQLREDKDGQFGEWLEIILEKDGRRLNWFVPAMMGDGQTPDNWYPFVFLNSPSEPLDRVRRFKAPNPWTGSDSWLVHAADLRTDDMVCFTPATLDFQWLDSAGKRFEIAYDERGQRRGLSRRPYLLDELETMSGIWKTLSNHLKMNQIHILRDLIETKRMEWQIDDQKPVDDNVFKEFCREAIVNAEWKNGKWPWEAEVKDRKEWLDQWADYAVRGWITDAIELHLQIMKEEVQDEF